MGRPLSKKYFANPDTGGVGGQQLASVPVTGIAPVGTPYSQGVTGTISAPQITGGTTATVSPVIAANGAITSWTITNAGSGYTAAPTLSIVKPASVSSTYSSGSGSTTIAVTGANATIYVGMQISGTGAVSQVVTAVSQTGGAATLTMNAATTISGTVQWADIGAGATNGTLTLSAQTYTGINCSAWTTSVGSNQVSNNDIIKQQSTYRYKVQSSDGTGYCALVARTPAAAGEMSITALDSSGNSYYVTKLTAHKATVVAYSGVALFANNSSVSWGFGPAAGGATGNVQIANT